jgi:hypothetical protein
MVDLTPTTNLPRQCIRGTNAKPALTLLTDAQRNYAAEKLLNPLTNLISDRNLTLPRQLQDRLKMIYPSVCTFLLQKMPDSQLSNLHSALNEFRNLLNEEITYLTINLSPRKLRDATGVRDVIISIINYLNAQQHINLGFKIDAIAPRLHTGGIGHPLWSTPNASIADISDWGKVFAERIEYIHSLGENGKISFIDPLRIDDSIPIDIYRLASTLDDWNMIKNGQGDIRRKYTDFLHIYEEAYGRGGCVTYFELCYLLAVEQPFEFYRTVHSFAPHHLDEGSVFEQEYPDLARSLRLFVDYK